MFGLMKAKTCSQPSDIREQRRLAYCGTCKTLGARYGQRTRVLLSHDTVFLAELLFALSPSPESVDKAYRSYNCLALPNPASAPLALSFAAAATLFITEGLLADHLQDAPSRTLRGAARLLTTPFHKAEADLRAWDLPVEELRTLVQSQTSRERQVGAASGRMEVDASLNQVAEPTRQATGMLFEAGARLIERDDAAHLLKELGEAFGTLIYLLDAFEDEPKDARRGEFNAFRAALHITESSSPEQRKVMQTRVVEAGDAVQATIQALPISEAHRVLFASRLRSNLHRRLGLTCATQDCAVCAKTPAQTSNKDGITSKAGDLTAATLRDSNAWSRALLVPIVWVLALPMALFFPAWMNEDTRLGEAYGLLFNLMAAGSVLRRAKQLVRPLYFAAEGPEEELLAELPEEAGMAAHKVKKSGGCGCCDCDGCDCCDSCGDCDCDC